MYTRYVYRLPLPLLHLFTLHARVSRWSWAWQRCLKRQGNYMKSLVFLYFLRARLRSTSTLYKFNLFFGAISPLTCAAVQWCVWVCVQGRNVSCAVAAAVAYFLSIYMEKLASCLCGLSAHAHKDCTQIKCSIHSWAKRKRNRMSLPKFRNYINIRIA